MMPFSKDDDARLAQEAYDVFEERFARPYRTCNFGPVDLPEPQRPVARRLEASGLVHEDRHSPNRFLLSEEGKDLAFDDRKLRRSLGLPTGGIPDTSKDPENVRRRARVMFEEYFRNGPQGLRIRGSTVLEKEACRYLARRGLLEQGRYSNYGIGETGEAVLMQEADLEELLAWTPPIPLRKDSPVVNNFHAPVGAVATAPGAVAHGSIQIQAVDQALHQLVELQDTLGALTDLLFPLLRRVRQVGIRGTSEEELRRVIADAEEVKAFETAVKSGMGREAVDAARKVVSGVSALGSVLSLLAPPG